MNAHAQSVSVEPDPPLGNPHEDTHAHSKCTELEVLMDTKNDLLHEVEEVEEETTGVTAAVDKECINLQGLKVSHLTMLKGANTLTFPSILLRIASPSRLPVIETGMWATRELRPGANINLLPLNLPLPKEAVETPSSIVPKQIQAPAKVERPSVSLKGKETWRTTEQDSQALVHTFKGKMPLEIAHGHPPNPTNPYMRGFTILEQNSINLKALVYVHQVWRPIPNDGAGVHINPWPDLSIIHTETDAYFKVLVLLEGEQNFALLSANSKQADTPKIFSFTFWPLVLLLPDTLGCNLKPSKGAEPEQHDVARHSVCLKLAGHVAEDPDKAEGAWKENVPPMPSCP